MKTKKPNQPTSKHGTPTYKVIVFDMYDYGEQEHVGGFPSLELATEYARRRVRDSVEHERPQSKDPKDLKYRWFSFGEDCTVLGGDYASEKEMGSYLANPTKPQERDWLSLDIRMKQK